MKRRDFLRYGIGLSLASSSLYSLANMMNHAQHGNMAMMHSAPTSLMPVEAMPSGLSLMVYYQSLLTNPLKLDYSKPL
nr:hypothetical protein [Rodentibacter heylii]